MYYEAFSLPKPCKIRSGISAGSRPDPGKIVSTNNLNPAANLAENLAGKQKSLQPKSHQDLGEKQNPGSQNLGAILPGISRLEAKFLSRFTVGISANLFDMLQRISFGAVFFQVKVKARFPVFTFLRVVKIQTKQT